MRVVVVGGGVAGAACAVALRRIGADVTVYEAYEDPAGPVGSFVSLARNGLRGLAALGCLEAVRDAGFPVARQRMWSGAGRLLADVARHRRPDDPVHSVTIWRADLVAALRAEAVRAGARIVTGRRVDAADPDLRDADLVVGADGIWSAVRSVVDPAAPKPSYAGLYTASGVSDLPDAEPGTFNMVFARRGAFIHVAAPGGEVWWAAQVAAPAPPDPGAVGAAALASRYPEAAPAAVLRATRRMSGVTLNHVLAPVTHRHTDRLVLVGDAAHPVGAGQGASMAIEDAVVLARELHGAGTVAGALAAFDALRTRRTGKMARVASTNRDAKTAGPLAARVRDLAMPLFFPRFYPRATNWLIDFDPGELPVAA